MRGFWKFLMVVPLALVLSSGGMARADDDTVKMLGQIRSNHCIGLAKKLTPLALAGNANAEFDLGEMYDRGCDVTQDGSRAVEWYQKAAAHGRSDAYSIGDLDWARSNSHYSSSNSGEYDVAADVEAVRWWRQAADQGDALAQWRLGNAYQEGGRGGLEEDYAKAMQWLRKAADTGLAGAQTSVGYLYDRGFGVPIDPVKAIQWYRKAAAQNEVYAQNNLGIFYENGVGVPQDYTEALRWYGLAAAQGIKDSQDSYNRLKMMLSSRIADAYVDSSSPPPLDAKSLTPYTMDGNGSVSGHLSLTAEGKRANLKGMYVSIVPAVPYNIWWWNRLDHMLADMAAKNYADDRWASPSLEQYRTSPGIKSAEVDENGNFTISGIAPGQYFVASKVAYNWTHYSSGYCYGDYIVNCESGSSYSEAIYAIYESKVFTLEAGQHSDLRELRVLQAWKRASGGLECSQPRLLLVVPLRQECSKRPY